MIRFLADEDFNRTIVRGVSRTLPKLDIVRVQEVGLMTLDDDAILGFAANERRIVLTHDVRTMPIHASSRLELGKPMTGLFVVRQRLSVKVSIEDIVVLAECSHDDEWFGQILYLPLR